MPLHPDAIEAEKADIVARYEPWTAHKIHLAGGVELARTGASVVAIEGREANLALATSSTVGTSQRYFKELATRIRRFARSWNARTGGPVAQSAAGGSSDRNAPG